MTDRLDPGNLIGTQSQVVALFESLKQLDHGQRINLQVDNEGAVWLNPISRSADDQLHQLGDLGQGKFR